MKHQSIRLSLNNREETKTLTWSLRLKFPRFTIFNNGVDKDAPIDERMTEVAMTVPALCTFIELAKRKIVNNTDEPIGITCRNYKYVNGERTKDVFDIATLDIVLKDNIYHLSVKFDNGKLEFPIELSDIWFRVDDAIKGEYNKQLAITYFDLLYKAVTDEGLLTR